MPPPPCFPNYSQTFRPAGHNTPPALPSQPPQTAYKQTPAEGHPALNSESQVAVDVWLADRGIIKKPAGKCKTKSNIQIQAVKEKINHANRLIKQLENASRTLAVMMKTVKPAEWDQKCTEVESAKNELKNILSELNLNKGEFDSIKERCLKRSKKRERLKRQSERRRKQKEELKAKSRDLHFQIDNWQKEMQEEVERNQREEDLKREADAVLWEVRHKTAEGRRQVALLSALLELREVRAKQLQAAGTAVTTSQIDSFNTVIERLRKMWTKHLAGCQQEEQMLRRLLTDAAVQTDPVKSYKRLVLQEWERVFFGDLGALDKGPSRADLIAIRREWDQFVVPRPSMVASCTPPGWVLPEPPSSDMWQTLLFTSPSVYN